MLEIRNRTPYAAALVPGLDREGRDIVTVVVKGTFRLTTRGGELPVADEQAPVTRADTYNGEPGASSVKYESEACPAKRGTDVVLVGQAFSPRPVESVDVSLSAGPLKKTVRVFGDRAWFQRLTSAQISKPLPFTRMPLVYERAFGGVDMRSDDPEQHGREPRNPLGTGFCVRQAPEDVEGVRLPNLEDPRALIASPADRPSPAGFGFIGRDFHPRAAHAGTYDEAWQSERCPFLPSDFDDRFFNGAHPELVSPRHFRGGESVLVSGASELGDVAFRVPGAALEIAMLVKGALGKHVPVLDTLLIEPDERRVLLTWKVTLPTAKNFLYIDWIRVTEGKRPA